MDRNNPTPEQLIGMLIEAAQAQGATAWWDGELVQISFREGSPLIRLTVNVEGDNLRDLVDRGFGPIGDFK